MPQKAFALRLAMTVAALAVWFWTQSLIGARGVSGTGIDDSLHDLTAPVNLYLHQHPSAANALLIVSSAIIDLFAIFLLGKWLFGGALRPFLSLVIVLGLRQIMEALVALPAPPNSIWHYPGVPSLLVSYGVSNDYFFSGHTAIAVLGAIEIARLRRPWLGWFGVAIAFFEISTVLVLRAHYVMDVFTGILAAFFAAHAARAIAHKLGRKTVKASGRASAAGKR